MLKYETRGKEMRAQCACGWESQWYVTDGMYNGKVVHRAVAAGFVHQRAGDDAQPTPAAPSRKQW